MLRRRRLQRSAHALLLLFSVVLCCVLHAAATVSGGAYGDVRRATCTHDHHSAPLHTLPHVQLMHAPTQQADVMADDNAAAVATDAHANATPMPQRMAAATATGRATAADARPLRIRLVYAFGQACTAAGDVVPTYDARGTTHTCAAADVLTDDKRRFITAVLDDAAAFLTRAYRALPVPPFAIAANACNGVRSDAIVSGGESDLIVFVTAGPVQQLDATVAWAQACMVVRESRVCSNRALTRPVVGQINFVPSIIGRYPTPRDVSVAAHELTHVLGFTQLSTQLRRYVRDDGTCSDDDDAAAGASGVREVWRPGLGKRVVLVTTPRVLRAARAHFGCDMLDGVEVEDGGGGGTAGSHWKKRLFYEEALVGTITSARLFYSSVTMAAMEDMGLLYANYAVAEDGAPWGRNRGCAFAYESCKTLVQQRQDDNNNDNNSDNNDNDNAGNSGSEFCLTVDDDGTQRCTFDRYGIGLCATARYSAPLPSNYRYFDGDDGTRGGRYATMDYCPAVDAYNNVNCLDARVSENAVNAQGSELGPHSRCFESNLVTNALPAFGSGVRCYPAACTSRGQLLVRVQGQTVACPADGRAGRADTSVLRTVSGSLTCPRARDICDGQDSSGLSTLPTTAAGGALPFAHSPVTIFASSSPSMTVTVQGDAATNNNNNNNNNNNVQTATRLRSSCASTCAVAAARAAWTRTPVCRALVPRSRVCAACATAAATAAASSSSWLRQVVGDDVVTQCTRPPPRRRTRDATATLARICLDGTAGADALCDALAHDDDTRRAAQ